MHTIPLLEVKSVEKGMGTGGGGPWGVGGSVYKVVCGSISTLGFVVAFRHSGQYGLFKFPTRVACCICFVQPYWLVSFIKLVVISFVWTVSESIKPPAVG